MITDKPLQEKKTQTLDKESLPTGGKLYRTKDVGIKPLPPSGVNAM